MPAKAARKLVLLDSSVLINFLVIDRLDLLVEHPRYRFLITGHVRREILDGNQRRKLRAALRREDFEVTLIDDLDELQIFGELSRRSILGAGECAVIAAAKHRGLLVGIDDKVAKRTAEELLGAGNILDTVKIIGSLIEADVIAVRDADKFIATWSRNCFTLPIRSFAELHPTNPRKKRRK
jgi:predicted nucleic acid-binding protein